MRRHAVRSLLLQAFSAFTAFALMLGASPRALDAQDVSSAERLRGTAPRSAQVTDFAERHFDRRDGIRSNSVYAVAPGLAGELWIGTDDGVLRRAGDGWTEDGTPPELRGQQVRALLQGSDGGQWFATRYGVFYTKGAIRKRYSVAQGLPDPVVYSLLETDAVDGTRRILAGSRSGVSVFENGRFRPLPLPQRLRGVGMMLAEAPASRDARQQRRDLWVASASGPVARLAQGVWTVFDSSNGLEATSSERLLVGRPNDSAIVSVAGAEGVFTLVQDARGERFERMPGSPVGAFRLCEASASGAPSELWVGTRDGYVYRSVHGVWERVRSHLLTGRGAILAMESVTRADGGMAMFIAVGGERLTRVALGSAASVDFPDQGPRESIGAIHAEQSRGGRATVWIGSNGGRGLVRIDANGGYEHFTRARGAEFANVHTIAHDSSDRSENGIWLGTDAGAFRWSGTRWKAVRLGMRSTAVWTLGRMRVGVEEASWTAGTSDGLFRLSGARWQAVPGTEKLAIHDAITIPAVSGAGDEMLLVSTTGFRMLDVSGLHEIRLPTGNHSANPNLFDVAIGSSLCRLTSDDGALRVFLGTGDGALYTISQRKENGRLVRDAAWTRLPPSIEVATRELNALRCEANGHLLLGTNRGLVVVDVSSADMNRWAVLAAATTDDGLPPGRVQAVASDVVGGVRFVGTPNGIGAVDVARANIGPAPRLSVQLQSAGRVGGIDEGERLPNGGASLNVRPSLQTDHREDAARYRVELVTLGSGGLEQLSTLHADLRDDEWTDDPARNYQALAPGQYLLRVRARDFVGREAVPFERRFAVATSPWKTPEAILGYLLCIVGVAVGAHFWRLAGVQRSHEQVVDGERRARASEQRFRALFDQSGDGHVLTSGGVVTAANPAAIALFGAPGVEALLGRPIASLVALPESVGVFPARTVETSLVRPDGTRVPVAFTLTTIPGDNDRLEHAVLRDLTDVRAAEQQREQLEARVRAAQNLESLGTLAGGVAHDFNNLLGVIRGNAELAQLEVEEPARVGEHLAEILDASARARDLVRQILTFSRHSAEEAVPVNLTWLVRDMHPMLRRILPASVRLTMRGIEQQHVVCGDATQLQQVVLNLVSNAEYAVRASNAGALDIELAEVPHPDDPARRMVRLSVRDNGVGMTPAVRARIFEPFYSTKPTGDGTGLGLAVLHGVVVSHRGIVQVETEEGQGTMFSILLPARLDHADPQRTTDDVTCGDDPATARDAEGDIADLAVRPACVVLVDDEPSVARVVDRVLSRAGHEVHTFATPSDALAFVAADPARPDLLVTDQTMPGMTGDSLALAVRALRPGLPVLILTGFSHRLTEERLAEVGAVAVLQKPVALPTLIEAVSDALAAGVAG